MNTLIELGLNFFDLFLDSAPWLLLGLFMAGMIKMFVPMSWMHKQLGGDGLKPTVKAALLGAPLPLCSCGVIPAAVGLRRSGASKSATTAFLVATPETGVDSVSVSYVLLGPFMAMVRPIAAITSAIVAGVLVGRDQPKPTAEQSTTSGAVKSCCSSKTAKAETKSSCCSSKPAEPEVKSSCCASKTAPEQATVPASSISAKLKQGLYYASTDLVRDTTMWLLVGLFFAALVNTFVPASFLSQWGNGIVAMTMMVLVSVPMYICATASTPIAAGLLLAGVSPGAVLVFMMAGPATNIATLGVVRSELGQRALAAYLTGVIGTAMLFGFAVDYLVAEYGFTVMPLVGEEHRLLPDLLVYASGALLAVLMIKALANKYLPLKVATA